MSAHEDMAAVLAEHECDHLACRLHDHAAHLADVLAPVVAAAQAAALRDAASIAEAIDDLGRTPFDDLGGANLNRFASHPLVKNLTRPGVATWLRDRAASYTTTGADNA